MIMDISVFIPTLCSAAISAAATGIGVYVGMSKQIAVLETKVDLLIEQMRDVSDLDPRVTRLETEVALLKEQHNARGCANGL